jgi:type IV pilus assembly protein PilN
MRRINLLPVAERRRTAERLRSGPTAILLIVGAAALILMVGTYLFFLVRLNGVEAEIAELDRRIAEQNARLADLAPYRDLQAQLDAKKPVADGIYRSRFAWDQFLQGLAFVIPESTALDTLVGEAAPVNLEAPPEETLEPPGAVTFTGIALPRYQNVADFVVQMNNLRYLSNAELNSAELDREAFAQPAIAFEVDSELVTVVGENGTEVRLEAGPSEAAGRGARDPYQAAVERRGAER